MEIVLRPSINKTASSLVFLLLFLLSQMRYLLPYSQTAKAKYKVSDRELLGIKERTEGVVSHFFPILLPPRARRLPLILFLLSSACEQYGRSRSSKYYYKAAVEALSLRSHGGVGGHQEHL